MDKQAQGSKPGTKANAYKGNNVGYSAKHKRATKDNPGKKCANCGATTNLVNATIHGSNGNKHKTMCQSCHAKYDKFDRNINKSSSLTTFIKNATFLLNTLK